MISYKHCTILLKMIFCLGLINGELLLGFTKPLGRSPLRIRDPHAEKSGFLHKPYAISTIMPHHEIADKIGAKREVSQQKTMANQAIF